ncbi:Lysine exporter protein (LYSE/YGGA) [Cellulomonas flavigena DSM 20109]|uniref:Lysine exporter protein (LYSE/YGGA) n=1 Tax=Cellulomonas flavigena (strain ATCC 482 / DSM 20109 / BCRC 11376 / JCM 18109 / NBRC 3775 / NCIMB 8073 / NRS 134) TaxID=446466 RepID=D5UHS0_CELFN|nr:LysE family translocator [Cellulomonas flavigena]ADG73344.1 Lysine exporter protein (LYSE/YGGA) [Cellulomonas flavigena DSM 20109]
MDGSAVVAFWAVSFVLVLTPGADWAYAISAGLRQRVAAPAVAGLLAGHLTHTFLVAAGVGALVSRAPTLLRAVTVVAAAYLVWLGVATLRTAAASHPDAGGPVGSRWGWAARGWGISGLNPKAFLLFLALLPQFTRASAPWPQPAQMVTLGLVHTASCAVVYTVVAAAAHRVLGARATATLVVARVSGIVMIGLGAFIAVEQLT